MAWRVARSGGRVYKLPAEVYAGTRSGSEVVGDAFNFGIAQEWNW
jgi:hypothetical protein